MAEINAFRLVRTGACGDDKFIGLAGFYMVRLLYLNFMWASKSRTPMDYLDILIRIIFIFCGWYFK